MQLATAAKPQLDLNKATSTKKETAPNLPNKGKLGRRPVSVKLRFSSFHGNRATPQLDYVLEKEYDVFKI